MFIVYELKLFINKKNTFKYVCKNGVKPTILPPYHVETSWGCTSLLLKNRYFNQTVILYFTSQRTFQNHLIPILL